jgi:CheY-like chemotaxis protein
VQGNVEARAGEFVRLAVSDTGCGMTPTVQARLFEPFGTKDMGKGMGLGLAGVYGAVRQLSGWIEYTTDVGMGTEFRVFLPSAPATEVLARIQAQTAAPEVKGTVLLVEPDDRVRGLARCILNWNDYKVVEADNSATALVLWDGQAANVDLLLTEIDLAGEMSGRELASRLKQSKPGLKVIYTCAVSAEQDRQLPATLERFGFIPKPYKPDKLIRVVQSCLSHG